MEQETVTPSLGHGPFVPALRTSPDLYAVSVPADVFTGDFYFFTAHENGHWFAIGDVTGHGLDSAVYMAMIQELIEERLEDGGRPSEVVASVHEALLPELPLDRFVSLVLGHLSSEGWLRLTNAGHCPPLLFAWDGMVSEIPSQGPILSVISPPRWTDFSGRLRPDEKLLLYTDGVVEAASPAGEELGVDRVGQSLARDSNRDARTVAMDLVSEVERFTAGAHLHDDLTVMVIGR